MMRNVSHRLFPLITARMKWSQKRLLPASSHGAKCPIEHKTKTPAFTEISKSQPVGFVRPFESIPGPAIYPFIGSTWDLKKRLRGKMFYEVVKDYRSEYGPIVRIKILNRNNVFIFDPREFLKVHRAEGQFPRNATQEFWPFQSYNVQSGVAPGLSKVGKKWQEARRKLQTDILAPHTAASYIPSLSTAAKDISLAFPTICHDMDQFCMRAVFDMFSAAILGRSYRTLISDRADPVGSEFASNTQEAFRLCGDLLVDPLESICFKWGITTSKYKSFVKYMDASYRGAELLTKQSLEGVTRQHGLLTPDFEVADAVKLFDGAISSDDMGIIDGSYIQRLVRRGALTIDEVVHEVPPLVFAGVDTTASALMWFLVNLARNPDKQALLANELDTVLQGRNFTADATLPYLRACSRESHRLTPAASGIGYRILDTDIELHGYNVPAGTRIHFNLEALQSDATIVSENDMFLPERWFPETVATRKGTPSEILDHRLIATPFSFGPRMCIGGRLAEVEILTAVCRLVQDYEFTLADNHPPVTRKERLMLMPAQSPNFDARPRRSNRMAKQTGVN